MLATTTISWALMIAAINENGALQAMTTVQGFGSEQACLAAQGIAMDHFEQAGANATTLFCLPVDAARPIPDSLRGLVEMPGAGLHILEQVQKALSEQPLHKE